ncbi:MAG: hypothetical protein N2235_21825 [Fischerella sp.]|nr:hypothetical protein [Fischerella sp.]
MTSLTNYSQIKFMPTLLMTRYQVQPGSEGLQACLGVVASGAIY